MNFARTDIWTIAIQGVIGALIGLSFGTAKLYSDRRIGRTLDVDTTALHENRRLWTIIGEIERRIDRQRPSIDAAFLRLISFADDIVFRHISLANKETVPQKEHESEAAIWITECRTQLTFLINDYEARHNDNENIDFRALSNRFVALLGQHVIAINRLTLHTRRT